MDGPLLAMLVQKQGLAPAITALVHDRAALLVAAMIGVVAGLAMALAHDVWSGGVVAVAVTDDSALIPCLLRWRRNGFSLPDQEGDAMAWDLEAVDGCAVVRMIPARR